MGWHLQTRSRNRDYCFLGQSPERWWAIWSGNTSFEKPTLLVESDHNGWRLLASGIPSNRHDRYRTSIRYTLVASAAHGEATERGLALIAAWLEEAALLLAGGNPGPVSRSLDERFSEEMLESWFEGDPKEALLSDEVGQQIELALAELASPAEVGESPEAARWYAGVQTPSCRQALVAQARRLLDGEARGGAYLLNLTEHPDEFRSPPELESMAFLFDVPDGRLSTPVHWRDPSLAGKKKHSDTLAAEPPAAPGGRRRRPSSTSKLPASHPARRPDPRRPDEPRRRGSDVAAGLDPEHRLGLGTDIGSLVMQKGMGIWEKRSELSELFNWGIDKGVSAVREQGESILEMAHQAAEEAGLDEPFNELLDTLEGLSTAAKVRRLEGFLALARSGRGRLDQAARALIGGGRTAPDSPLAIETFQPADIIEWSAPTGVGPRLTQKRPPRELRVSQTRDHAVDLILCRAPDKRKQLIKERLERARRPGRHRR